MNAAISSRRPRIVQSRSRRSVLCAAVFAVAALIGGNIPQAWATSIGAGHYHGLWIKGDNSLWAWGDNWTGQLGDGTKVDRSSPVKLAGVGAVADAAGGEAHTVVARTDGTVLAWGANDRGQLGDGTGKTRTLPTVLTGIAGANAVAAGFAHSLALKTDGTVWTWGANDLGQLGDGSTIDRNVPVIVTGLKSVAAIGAGHMHSLAVRSDGTVWTWGRNDFGQLGDGSTTSRPAPVRILGPVSATLPSMVAVAGGIAHSLALAANGTVWAWGANLDGQLGTGNHTARATPVQVPGLSGVVAIAAAYSSSVALKADGTVWVWGYNGYGELGVGTTASALSPVQVTTVTGVVGIAAGSDHLLLLRNDGSVWAAGTNITGQLGDGSAIVRSAPALFSGLTNVATVAAAGAHTLAVGNDGRLWAWGRNDSGELGDGTYTNRGNAVRAGTLTGVTAAAGGYLNSLALKSDGTLWSWGDNTFGELGDGTTTDHIQPALVPGLSGITAVAAGFWHSVALRSDGTVWAWGRNNHGQVGDGTTSDRSVPFKVPGLSGVIAIAAGGYHTLALLSDGTVRAWGSNQQGQLGDGSSTDRPTPVKVGGLSGVTAIAAGGVHSVALLSDMSVRAWGNNVTGQLGDGTTVARTAPVIAVGAANITSIGAGGFVTFALRSDGAALAWGRGGMVGTGTDADATVPTVLRFLRNLAKASSNIDHTVVLTADGRIFGWGSNLGQELGIAYLQQSAIFIKVKDTQYSNTTLAAPASAQGVAQVQHKAAPGSFDSADLVVEFFNPTIVNVAGNPGIGHYFLTASAAEATSIDNGGSGPGWKRTGRTFRAWNISANAPTGAVGVCRFYAKGPNSHFYTANAGECQGLRNLNPTNDASLGWSYEGIAFYTKLPAGSACQAGYYPVYRSYNNRFAFNDSNHRITPSYVDYLRSIRFFGYLDEGIVFCTPASSDAGADLQATYTYPGSEAVAGSTLQAQFIYGNNGPGKGDGGTIYMGLPAATTNWAVACVSRNGASCPASLDPNRLREGQPIAAWPAGGVITLNATGTAPPAPAGGSTTLEFASVAAVGNGSPDPMPENNSPPPAQTVIKSATVCSYAVNPGMLSFGAAAQTLPAAIVAPAGCNWTAQSGLSWLSVAIGNGTGNATLPVSVQPNVGTTPRTGTITVSGAQLFVVQAGVAAPNSATACANLRLQREGDQTPADGLTGATSVAVFADGQCSWSAQSGAPWITLTSGGGGNGNGTISYVAQPNADIQARSATITVADKQFVVNQLGQVADTGAGSDGGGDSGGASGGDSGGSSGGDSG